MQLSIARTARILAAVALLLTVLVSTAHAEVPQLMPASKQTGAQPGDLLWTFASEDVTVRNGEDESGPVFIESLGGELLALDTDTGNWRWHFAPDPTSDFNGPMVVDGVVYVGNINGTLYAVDAETGVEQWHVSTGNRIYSTPQVIDGVVYFGDSDVTLYALDATTGTERWRFTAEEGASGVSVDAISDKSVFIHTWTGTFYAIDATTGDERWHYPTDCSSCGNHLEVSNDVVLISNYSLPLEAHDSQTGEMIWSRSASDWQSEFTLSDGVAYFEADDVLYALDAATGAEHWNFPADLASRIVVQGGMVFFGDDNRTLYALDAETGAERWHFLMKYQSVFAPPMISDGVLYISDSDTFLYAINVDTGAALWDLTLGNEGIVTYQVPLMADGIVIYRTTDDVVMAIATYPPGPDAEKSACASPMFCS